MRSPNCGWATSATRLDSLRDFYLQRARQRGLLAGEARFFTDKMPLNEVHLGLIGLIFPRSPLVHMIRHPLDIMVSAMSNFFTHGGFCGSQLETAAEHLVLSNSLVAHYRRVMELNYRAVRYEDVVDDQEATMRGVFDFVGVPFDPRALSFEENVRYARTASYAQVTEKLYDRSRYRYRHYLKQLEPALPILKPLMDEWGYEV
ncbi:sulfotransferase family protein [Jiella pelagia]|uniref:Sulfotransferase n=1 Tax=Jiella pelagia TaxID=2986949 RepID=A0ABY7C5I0_9HYPH|nr:sulfotransferase [Jiella pelagia]WAP70958.1 sulfotransferase [Jiella pelagia]